MAGRTWRAATVWFARINRALHHTAAPHLPACHAIPPHLSTHPPHGEWREGGRRKEGGSREEEELCLRGEEEGGETQPSNARASLRWHAFAARHPTRLAWRLRLHHAHLPPRHNCRGGWATSRLLAAGADGGSMALLLAASSIRAVWVSPPGGQTTPLRHNARLTYLELPPASWAARRGISCKHKHDLFPHHRLNTLAFIPNSLMARHVLNGGRGMP